MKTNEVIRESLEALQQWFAAKPYGWKDAATPGQLQQWADRESEQDALICRLELIEG
jgi:hypothetical protein